MTNSHTNTHLFICLLRTMRSRVSSFRCFSVLIVDTGRNLDCGSACDKQIRRVHRANKRKEETQTYASALTFADPEAGEMCVCECVGEYGEVMRRSDTARTDDKCMVSSENVCWKGRCERKLVYKTFNCWLNDFPISRSMKNSETQRLHLCPDRYSDPFFLCLGSKRQKKKTT
jgi:hypothetical protein